MNTWDSQTFRSKYCQINPIEGRKENMSLLPHFVIPQGTQNEACYEARY